MMKRITLDEVKQRIQLHHDDQITIDEATFNGLRSRCRFIDKDYGEWYTDLWSVLCGGRHPKRGRASMGLKQTVTRDEMIKRLRDVCGDLVILGDDYVGASTKCTFIDKDFGQWKQLPQRLLTGTVHPKRRAQKARTTCLSRYGVTHTNHIPAVWSKINAKRLRWVKRFHWKTGAELTCMSSYEVAFVEWCAKHTIDFDWQISHKMSDGRVYIVDAFIKDGEFTNTWIEIKGWMRPEGRRKWEWFHSNHPNSQLWTLAALLQHGVLTR